MPSSNGTARRASPLRASTASAIGVSISVVAELEIHIEISAAVSMKASTSRQPPCPPTRRIMPSAKRSWIPDFSMALDSMKAAIRSRMTVLPSAAEACWWVSTPDSGKAAKGSSDAAGIGMLSNTHQMAVLRVMAAVQQIFGSNPFAASSQPSKPPARGPATRVATFSETATDRA